MQYHWWKGVHWRIILVFHWNHFTSFYRMLVPKGLKDSQGANLALEFLVASQNCFNNFINWTKDFYHKLQSMSACSEEEAWQLILECWLAFFIDLRSIRMECASISLAGLEPDSTCRKEVVARFIWTMGRTIKLQDEYHEKQFRNHHIKRTNQFFVNEWFPYFVFSQVSLWITSKKKINTWSRWTNTHVISIQIKF